VFHAGWSLGPGREGGVMVRDPDVYASAGDIALISEVTSLKWISTGAMKPRDGKPV
jgi:hypothetical protein